MSGDVDQARDTYYVDSPTVRTFIDLVQRVIDDVPERARTVELLRAAFGALLNDKDWLPGQFQEADAGGGMGGGIGNYLLYRSAARDLTLFSLVVPPGSSTPIHDHLTWGLVGLYAGEQDERVYRRLDDGQEEGRAKLLEIERRLLRAGDFYTLLPPAGDIHAVTTVSDVPSVSIHLLGNDIGCTWRHRFDVDEHAVFSFRSSYSNEPCPDEVAPV